MNYWILKTEPSTYSFDHLLLDGSTVWSGVRNYQARNNLRLMKSGDVSLIYHSVDEKSFVGTAKVTKDAFKDPSSDGDWSAVTIIPLKKLKKRLTLSEMKSDKMLKNISLVKNSRLSVCPITKAEFEYIISLSR
jgi:predicted RNA-binding protein with PUA-like domain